MRPCVRLGQVVAAGPDGRDNVKSQILVTDVHGITAGRARW